jgi:DNA-binding MarR family transcriptional regulator/N-acetylglutamate synthase-like GNAT family acetyltransferase
MTTLPSDAQIQAVRRFSRFYTKRIGALNEGLNRSPFSLPEARLLWEIGHREEATATELCGALGLDPGYASRLLSELRRRGYVAHRASPEDGRRVLLRVTKRGEAACRDLDDASSEDVTAWLGPLREETRARLVSSMATIESILGDAPEPRVPYILRTNRSGDMGWVVGRHGVLYAEQYGWGETFEALTAEIVAKFVQRLDPKRERCWIAERDGTNVGCVFIVKQSKTVARLRLLLVEPEARGLGIGKRLVQECVRFSRQVGYRKITLWTMNVLTAARGIYEKAGFQLVASEPYDQFGDGLLAETWDLAL